MRYRWLCFLGTVIFLGLAVDRALPQNRTESAEISPSDWSVLFPQIPGCEREIQPINRHGNILEQVAVYERANHKGNKGENYVGCGTITLISEPNARKKAQKRSPLLDFPSWVPSTVRGFPAYQSSPLCGNDFWTGSTHVYFDKDKVLVASAYMGAEKIIEFAQNADYRAIKRAMNRLANE